MFAGLVLAFELPVKSQWSACADPDVLLQHLWTRFLPLLVDLLQLSLAAQALHAFELALSLEKLNYQKAMASG